MKILQRMLALCLLLATSVALVLPSAAAAPAPAVPGPPAPRPPVATPGPPAPGTTQIGWNQLGVSNRIEIAGTNQPAGVAVPVPQGVMPTVVTGQIGSVVNVSEGQVDVFDQKGILLGTIPVPTDLSTQKFVIKTSAAQVTDGRAELNFVLRDRNPPATSCSQPATVVLDQLATTYSGLAPNPRTVADFLPGYLDSISIRVGPQPTPEQQQAALTLVAELTQRYRPIPVRIDVDTSAGPPSASTGTSRIIEIRNGGQPQVAVEQGGTPAAVLVISGDGAALLRQVQLFTDRRVALAQSPTASVTSETENLSRSTNILTFSQLGMAGQASVLGTSTLYTGFDVTAFAAGSIQGAKIHVRAQYTPVVSGEGSVLVKSGSNVLATHTLDNSGTLDMSFDVPAEAISSYVGLALELRYNPDRECAPLSDRMTFALDPQSTVSVNPGTFNRGGFAVLPMAFTPDFNVAVDRPDQIRYAARAINLMGQQTAEPLRPNVTTLKEAAGSGVGLLVVATGSELAQAGMLPPVNPGEKNSVKVDGSPVTDVDLGGPLGVVQAFAHNNRTVLAIDANADWSLVDKSFDYIAQLESRWTSLTGDVVATGAAGVTVNLTIRDGGPMAHQPDLSTGWTWWLWATVAIGVLVVLAVAGLLIVRRRRAKV
jgi:hypothetical protein